MSAKPSAFLRGSLLVLAPATLLAGGIAHPWIGRPSDTGFLSRLSGAVADGPNRWAVAHLLVALGSALLMLAFFALHRSLQEVGAERWSLWGLPFILVGSTLYALLPAMEFAPLAAYEAGADAAAAQAALMPWFGPTLLVAAFVFALGVVGFAVAIARSGAPKPFPTWLVLGALAVMAAARFVPVGVAQLYIGPAAGIVALWPLAWAMRREPQRTPARRTESVPAA